MDSCGTNRCEGFAHIRRKRQWMAREIAKKRTSGVFKESTEL
jgi:hypothetical protein